MKTKTPFAAICVVLALAFAAGCKKKEAGGAAVTQVTVANPKMTEVTDHIDFTGTVGAVQSVNIVARVEGYLEGIYFQDGSYVKKGTPLFKIQQEQYIEDLKLYQAQLTYSSAE